MEKTGFVQLEVLVITALLTSALAGLAATRQSMALRASELMQLHFELTGARNMAAGLDGCALRSGCAAPADSRAGLSAPATEEVASCILTLAPKAQPNGDDMDTKVELRLLVAGCRVR